jgi:predicted metal-dependent hydrolase
VEKLAESWFNVFGMYLLGKMFIQLIPEYLSYYQADFHPAKHDYTKLVNYWKARMADEWYGQFSRRKVSKLYS